MLKQRLEVERAFQPRAALLGARSLLGSNDDLRPLLDLLSDADIEQSTIVLNMLWDSVGAPAASIVRDAAGIHKALTQAKERNDLLGRQGAQRADEAPRRISQLTTPANFLAVGGSPGQLPPQFIKWPLERLRCYIIC